jgi:hypothetical protein
LKLAAFAPLWGGVARGAISAIDDDVPPDNLCALFTGAAAATDWRQNLQQTLEIRQAHPTDSHPPLRQRIEAMNLSPESVVQENLDITPSCPAIALLEHPVDLERSLSADLKYLLRSDRHILFGSA